MVAARASHLSLYLRGALARQPNQLAHLPPIWLGEAARLLPELIVQRPNVSALPALTDASARVSLKASRRHC